MGTSRLTNLQKRWQPAEISTSATKGFQKVVLGELNDHSVNQRQSEWDNTTKGAITKPFVPKTADRLKMKINVTPNLTTMVTGHGNIKSYLHKYKIIDSPMCSCKSGEQTVDHILFDCKLLEQERDSLKAAVLRSENWPVSKDKLINKYNKNCKKFTNNIGFINYSEQ